MAFCFEDDIDSTCSDAVHAFDYPSTASYLTGKNHIKVSLFLRNEMCRIRNTGVDKKAIIKTLRKGVKAKQKLCEQCLKLILVLDGKQIMGRPWPGTHGWFRKFAQLKMTMPRPAKTEMTMHRPTTIV